MKLKTLIPFLDDASDAGGIRIISTLEPLGGESAPVAPPTYSGGVFQTGRRFFNGSSCDFVVLDAVASVANRVEVAIESALPETGAPNFVLDLSECTDIPPGIPRKISIWQFPHRHGDANLRDSVLNRTPFLESDLGREVYEATPTNAEVLLNYFPGSLLFGYWTSGWGKKSANTRSPRVMCGEIIGIDPAVTEAEARGTKRGLLGLSGEIKVGVDKDFRSNWNVAEKGGNSMSDIGHGSILYPATAEKSRTGQDRPSWQPVSFREISMTTTFSFANLRKIRVCDTFGSQKNAAARALLLTLGLFGHERAFTGHFSLRSRCDLHRTETTSCLLGGSESDDQFFDISEINWLDLLIEAKAFARETCLKLDGWDAEPVILKTKQNLATAIAKQWGPKE